MGRRNRNRDDLGRFADEHQHEKEVHARRRASKARDRHRRVRSDMETHGRVHAGHAEGIRGRPVFAN